MNIRQALPRKVIAAVFASILFAVILGLIDPNPFGQTPNSLGNYLEAFILATAVYLLYSFPVILIYGTLTSTTSDFIAYSVASYTNKPIEFYVTLVLHLIFGLILLWYSLLASIIFLVIDKMLSRKKGYKWKDAFKSVGVPVLIYIAFMIVVNIIDTIRDIFFN